MYITTDRLRNPGRHVYFDGSRDVTTLGYRSVEAVYSFRTGRSLKGLTHTSYAAPGATLAQRLAARKEYLEGLDRSFSSERAPISYTQGRTNAFTRVKHRCTGDGRAESRSRNTLPWQLVASGQFFLSPKVPSDFIMGPLQSGKIYGSNIPPSRNSMQNYGSNMHSALNPLRASIGIGETVAEILSGNIPKLASNFYKILADLPNVLRRAPKAASQDYLNANFGLGPIFQDLYKFLIDGITLHDALFGTSFRRGSNTDLYSESFTGPKQFTVGVAYRRPDGSVTSRGSSFATTHALSARVVHDLKFRARFTLARNPMGSGNYDRALSLVRQYGLWTPSLLWDLTPWTWVLDWFTGISRGITTAFDYGKDGGLHSDYACVTSRTVVHETISAGNVSWMDTRATNRRYWSYGQCVTDTIVRIPVNPFGRYVDITQLSTWQKSILLALGLAKTTR